MQESLTRRQSDRRRRSGQGGQETELGRSLLPPDDVERVVDVALLVLLLRDVFHSFLTAFRSYVLHNFFGLGVFVGDESASAVVLRRGSGHFCLLGPPGSLTCFCFVVTQYIIRFRKNRVRAPS